MDRCFGCIDRVAIGSMCVGIGVRRVGLGFQTTDYNFAAGYRGSRGSVAGGGDLKKETLHRIVENGWLEYLFCSGV